MTEVPCNGCTACCRHQIVLLNKHDEPNIAAYDHRQIGEHRVLNNKPNGDCTHLGSEGCTIYDKRPFVCRTYDCRKHFKTLAPSEQRRFANSALGEEARKRLASLDADDLADLPGYRLRSAKP